MHGPIARIHALSRNARHLPGMPGWCPCQAWSAYPRVALLSVCVCDECRGEYFSQQCKTTKCSNKPVFVSAAVAWGVYDPPLAFAVIGCMQYTGAVNSCAVYARRWTAITYLTGEPRISAHSPRAAMRLWGKHMLGVGAPLRTLAQRYEHTLRLAHCVYSYQQLNVSFVSRPNAPPLSHMATRTKPPARAIGLSARHLRVGCTTRKAACEAAAAALWITALTDQTRAPTTGSTSQMCRTSVLFKRARICRKRKLLLYVRSFCAGIRCYLRLP